MVDAACVDPSKSYDQYIESTNDIRGSHRDAGDNEGGLDGGIGNPLNGSYHLSCLSNVLNNDPTKALRFRLDVSVDATTDDAATVTMKIQPLNAKTTTLTQTIGEVNVRTTPLAADGTFSDPIGTLTLPGDGNPLGDNEPISAVNSIMKGGFLSNDNGCAELYGQLTAPLVVSLDTPGDICIFVRSKDGSAPPLLDKTVYDACPAY